jgi:dTMP kinase
MARGIFIAIEGIDGSGTTTHSKRLAEWIELQNIPVLLTHEPTDSEIGKLIRHVLRDKNIPPATDALLFAADRVDHTQHQIIPALNKGFVVISDRYVESSIAYQSSSGLDLDWVAQINRFAIIPDLTLLLDLPPSIGLGRKRKQGYREKFEYVSFLKKVRQVFLNRSQEKSFTIINAGSSIQEVQSQIRKFVKPLLRSLK